MSICCIKNSDELYDTLKNLDNIPDKKLYHIVSKNYSNIMQFAIDRYSAKFRFVCTSSRIISSLTQVLADMILTDDSLIRANAFLFESITKFSSDEYINKLLLMMGRVVNSKRVRELDKLTFLDKDLCTFIAISWKSSFKEFLAVRRVNFTICTSSYHELTPDQIIQIYYVLSRDHIMHPMISSMLDTTMEVAANREEEWVTDFILRNNKAIMVAMVAILESLPPASISRILRSYYEQYRFENQRSEVYSICDIVNRDPQKFIKLYIIIDELKDQDIYIP